MGQIQVNALSVRALKTFVQAGGAFLVAGLTQDISAPFNKALLVGALAAGISAVMNLFIMPTEAK